MTTVAPIGCAHIHTPGFTKKMKERAGLNVKYVWDPNPARSSVRAGELGAKAIKSSGRAFKDPQVSGVIICSETNLHRKLVPAAARAGKHIFAEKPLGMGARDSFAMAQAVARAGVKFQTGYFNRSLPAIRFIKQEIDAGHLGRITRIRGSNCHSGSLGGWFDAKPQDPAGDWRWMADPEVSGCGGFGDLGTHLLDILMWMMGDVERVAADIKVVTGRYGDTDESGEALIRFRNGVTGTLAAGWVDVADPARLLVSGTEGHAAILSGQLFYTSRNVEGADGKNPWPHLPPALPHAFDLFLDALDGRADAPLVSVHEAAARVAVMEAMYKAIAKGKWITPATA